MRFPFITLVAILLLFIVVCDAIPPPHPRPGFKDSVKNLVQKTKRKVSYLKNKIKGKFKKSKGNNSLPKQLMIQG
jgi:hypothetical protein